MFSSDPQEFLHLINYCEIFKKLRIKMSGREKMTSDLKSVVKKVIKDSMTERTVEEITF